MACSYKPDLFFQIQVRNPKFSGVGATLIKIGREEGLRGYFKVDVI